MMRICQHVPCTKPATRFIAWRVWKSKADKLKGPTHGITGVLDVAVCDEHVPKTAKEILTDEGKALVHRELSARKLPWPKWSTAEVETVPL